MVVMPFNWTAAYVGSNSQF